MVAATEARIDGIWEVPGFFGPLDADLFARLFEVQAEGGVVGDLLEIGAWYGRSAILLEHARAEREVLHVCDLFEDTPPTRAGRTELAAFTGKMPTRADFEAWFLSFHPTIPVVHQGPSSALNVDELGRARFRFVHIDGSHTYDAVRQDIATARDVAAEDAVIVFDDFANVGHPSVAAALWPALAEPDLIPFACSPSKLYVARSLHWADRYRASIEKLAALMGYRRKLTELPEAVFLSVWSVEQRRPFRARVAGRVRRSFRTARVGARMRRRKPFSPDYIF